MQAERILKRFGNAVRRERKRRGLSQEELAFAAGASTSATAPTQIRHATRTATIVGFAVRVIFPPWPSLSPTPASLQAGINREPTA